MNAYIYTFEVTGRVPFPMDMLRYDACHPMRSEDASMIALSLEGESRRDTLAEQPDRCFRVRLARVWQRGWVPTAGRWSSFLWSVDPTTVTVSKLP